MARNENQPCDYSLAPGNHRVSIRVILIALCLAALIPLQFNAAHAKDALAKPPDALFTPVSSVDTMTAFGRNAKEKAGFGSNHGNATTWFVVGNSIRGGIYGDWPGLTESELYRGGYLAHPVDFRDITGEVLTRHLGNTDLDLLLPGHTFVALDLFETF